MAEPEIYELPEWPRRVATGCPAAVRFQTWVDEHLAELEGEGKPSPLAVHRTVVRLTWKFYFERAGAEPEHRDRVTEANGERCIYGVFLVALDKLHAAHMAAEKLELIEKVPVPAAAPEPQPRIRSVAEAMTAALNEVM